MRWGLLVFIAVVGGVSASTAPCLEQCRKHLDGKVSLACEAGCGYAQRVAGLSLRDKCSRDCSSAYVEGSEEIVGCCRGCTYQSGLIEEEQEVEEPVRDGADEVEEESPVRRVIVGIPVGRLIGGLLGHRREEEEREQRSPGRIVIGGGGPSAALSRLFRNLFGRRDDDEEPGSPGRIVVGGPHFGGGEEQKAAAPSPFGSPFGGGDGSSMVRSMLDTFMKDFRSFGGGGDGHVASSGTGKITVIKSGPGFHEEKTYRFGSDVDPSKILNHEVDDMMTHQNPLDLFLDPAHVETFNPSSEEKMQDDAKLGDDEERKTWNAKVGKLPNEPGKQQRVGGEGVDFGNFVFVGDACSLDRGQMNWSDWFSCLGLSSCLLAASVSLGLLFVLWMCFCGGPCGRARKQKIREAKMIGTKEAEAGMVVGGAALPKKVELPPSYNSVVNDFGDEFTAKVDLGAAEPLPDEKKEKNGPAV